MADEVDNRIVEMQFENKDFERNIQVSQKSLEKFKKELNFQETSRGIEEFSKSMKNVDFSVMENNIQKLTDKFTGLGTVGEFVLSRIRRTMEGLADKAMSFVNSLTTAQVSAGFVKYESLNKSVQTLKSATGKDEKEIYAVLDRLTKYTDETSYDMSQGVTSISQLVSSGAATLDQAERTVEGFYNYAAKAGADTQKASQALNYSFVQAMQKGYLDWMNAKELSNRSLLTMDFKNQLLEEAVAVGTLTKENGKYYLISTKKGKKVKEEVNATNKFNDSLKKQWATTKVLNNVMAKYQDTNTEFGLEAYKAAQRCTTFTDALNAWKDAASTGWMTTYRTVFGDLSEAMALFSGVCNKVGESLTSLAETRNKILNGWKELGGRDSLMGLLFGEIEDVDNPDGEPLFKGAYGILDIFTQAGNMVSDGWWNMVKNLIPKNEQQMLVDEVNKNIEALNRQLVAQGQGELQIQEPFKNFDELWNSEFAKGTGLREGAAGGGLNEATQNVQKFIESVHEWFNTVDEGSGTTRLEKIQSIINAIVNTISFGFDIIGGLIDFIGVIGEQLTPSIDAIGTLFSGIAGGIENGEQAAREGGTIKAFFTTLGEIIQPVTGAVNGIVTAIVRLITALAGSKDVAGGAATAWDGIKNALTKVWELIKAIAGPIVTFITTIINGLAELFEGGVTEENVAVFKEKIGAAFSLMIEGIKAGIKPVYEKIKTFLTTLWTTVSTAISGYFADENSFGHKAVEWITNFVNQLKDGLNTLFPGATEAISGFFTNLVGNIKEGVETNGLFGGIKNLGAKFVEKFKNLFSNGIFSNGLVVGVKEIISRFAAKFKGLFSNGIFEGIKEIAKSISNVFTNLFAFDSISQGATEGMGFLQRLEAVLIAPGSLGEGLLKIFRAIRDWWNDLNGETKAIIVIAAVVGFVIVKIVKAFKTIAEGVSDLTSVINGSFKVKKQTFSEKLLILAGALALMTAALYTLGHMSLDEGWKGLGFMAGIILELVAFCFLMKEAVKGISGKDFLKVALLILSISVAIRKIVNALLPVATLTTDELKNMGLTLAAITGAIVLVLGFVRIAKSGKGSKGGSSVLMGLAALFASIAALIVALMVVANVETGKLIKMGLILTVLSGIMLGFVYLMGKMKNSKGLKDSDLWQMIGLAAGIAVLVLALKQVADTPWEGLGKMGAAFGGIILGLIALIIAVNKTAGQNGRGLKGSGLLAVVGLALGIAALILVLKMVADTEWEDLGKMGATFGVIMIGLIAMVVAIGKSAGQNGRGLKGAGVFAGLAAIVLGIAGLILVLQPIANMSIGGIAKMLVTFGVIMFSLIMLVKTIGDTAGENGRGFAGASMFAGMFALFYGIERLLHYMMPLTKMPYSDLVKLWISMALIFGGLKGFLKNIPKDIDFGIVVNTVLMMGGFIGSIWALIEVIKPLTEFSWGSLAKMGAGFIVLSVVLKSMTKSIMKMSKNNVDVDGSSILNTIASMAAVAGGLYLIIEVLKPLAGFSWGSLVKMGAGFIVLGAILTAMTKSLLRMSDNASATDGKDALKTLAVMAGLSVAMIALSYSLSKIKNIKMGTIMGFTIGLSAMILSMAAATKLLSNASPAGILIGLVALVAGIAAMMGVIGLLGPWMLESIGKSLPAFGEGLQTLGEAIKSFSEGTSGLDSAKVDSAVGLITAVAKVQAALTAENISIAVFSNLTGQNIDKGNLQEFGADMAAVGGFVGEFCDAIKGKDFSNVDNAAAAISAISDVQKKLTDQNIELAIFNTLVGLAGGEKIEPGNIKAFTEDVVLIAPMLKEIADSIGTSDFSNFGNAANAISALVGVQGALNGQQIKMGVFSTLVGAMGGEKIEEKKLSTFVDDIVLVAPKLKEIGDRLGETDFDNFETAAGAIKALVSAQEALNGQQIAMGVFNAITQKAAGVKIEEKKLSDFVDDVVIVAPKLKEIGDRLGETKFDNFETAAGAIKAMASVQGALNGQQIQIGVFNALINRIGGEKIEEKNLSTFVDDIVAIAPKLSEISAALDDNLNFDNMGKAAEALQAFAELQGVLSQQGIQEALANMVLDIFGSDNEVDPKDLEDFGNDLIPLGEALSKFAYSVTYVKNADGELESLNLEAFDSAIRAIEALGKLQSVLPTVDGVFSWVTGHQQDMKTFAENVGYLGEGIRNIYDNVYLIKEGNTPEASDIETLASLISAIGNLAWQADMRGDAFTKLQMGGLISRLQAIINLSNPSNAEDIERMTNMLTALASASEGISHYTSGLKNFDILNDLITDSALQNKLIEVGETLTKYMTDGFNSDASLTAAKTAMNTLLTRLTASLSMDILNDSFGDLLSILGTEASNASEDAEWSFKGVGYNIAAGVAVGVTAGTYLIENACRVAVQRAKEAAMDEADEQSPSRVFMMIGEYMGKGMAIGIDNSGSYVEKSAKGIAGSAVEHARQVLKLVASALFDSPDDGLTITPIVDLSNVEAANALINGELSGERKINLSSNGNSYAMDSIPRSDRTTSDYQAPDLSGIIGQIEGLGGKIETLAAKVGNMQVVLDTGGLVGAVTGGVNRNLGAAATYRRRRN